MLVNKLICFLSKGFKIVALMYRKNFNIFVIIILIVVCIFYVRKKNLFNKA